MSAWDALSRDVRYAGRVLRRTPAFTLTAVITLALVIGANTAVFSLADAILLRPLPYPHPDRLASLAVVCRSPGGEFTMESHDGTTWDVVRQSNGLDAVVIAGSFGRTVNLVAGATAMSVTQARVGAGYFRVLGVPPFRGREFTESEDRPGGPAVAVLSYALWQRLFDGKDDAIGRTIRLRGEPYQVVGVMPREFENPGEHVEVWTPVRPSRTGEGGGTNYGILARLPEGRTWSEALAGLPPVDAQFVTRVGLPSGTSARFSLLPLQQVLAEDVRQPIEMLSGAVLMVLLIACANLAALLLARGGTRARELATRLALGSGRAAIIRQLLTESVMLGLAGGALGILVGYVGLEGLKAQGGVTYAGWNQATLNARALAASAGLSILTALLFGLVPAAQASRVGVQAALADAGSRAVAGGSRQWMRRALVVAEVALGVVLLVVTGLLIRTFVNLRALDPGFDPSHLVTTSVSLQDARYKSAAAMNHLFDETIARLGQASGVEAAAVSLELPYRRLLNMGFRFSDQPADAKPGIANVMYVTPDFFRTLRIPLRAGRTFGAADTPASRQVVVVNETFVRLEGGGQRPLGRSIRLANAEREIVGVVGDVRVTSSGFRLAGMAEGPLTSGPLVFMPAAQTPDGFLGVHTWFSPMWSVRTSDPAGAARALQDAIASVDPLLPVGHIQTMDEVRAAATSRQHLVMTLIGVVAGAALLLAAVGISGVISQIVAARRREFGIRIALGATPAQTMRGVVWSGVGLAAIGATLGVGLASLAVRLVESFLVGVSAHDPSTYVFVAGGLLLVAGLASILPAWRLLRIDPAEALRS